MLAITHGMSSALKRGMQKVEQRFPKKACPHPNPQDLGKLLYMAKDVIKERILRG